MAAEPRYREPGGGRARDRRGEGRPQQGMFESSFTFLRVKGIEIGAHWSWLFVFALVVWALGSQLFPRTYPDLEQSTYWIMAAVAAVVFFASVLLHELGHALTALKNGMHIDGITLWLFGGVAKFSHMFPSPGVEAKIALMGPAVSLALALGFAALAWTGVQLDWSGSVRGVVDYLARINAIVLGFNLVPALPLDGGRVLRAWLWHRQRSFEAATANAARAGKAFGGVLIGIGLLGIFTGAGTGGLWIAFIGWFLLQAAGAEAAHAQVRGMLRGLRVRDLMTPEPVTLRPDASVEEVVTRAASGRTPSSYPIVDADGRLTGFVSLRRAAAVPPERRGSMLVRDVMLARPDVPTVAPETDVFETLPTLQREGRAVVVDGDRPVGVLSLADLSRTLEVRAISGPPAGEEAPRRPGIAVWLVVGIAILLAAGYLYRPPVAALGPGPAIDVADDIRISGTDTTDVQGRYLLTSVSLSRPNGLGALYALFHPDRDLVALGSVVPRGVDVDDYLQQQRAVFEESRRIAAVAAARAVGMDVSISGAGAAIQGVLPGSPAADELQAGDVIVAVDGEPVRLATELTDLIRARPAGAEVELTVERNGAERTVTLRTRRLEQAPDQPAGIGVFVRTADLDVDLPFDVQFTDRNVGGPSAGLAYALAIADILAAENIADGRTIAATGTIGLEGDVGVVGGVNLKATGVAGDDPAVFLVPEGEVGEARGGGDVRVRGVGTLEEALRILGYST